MRALILLALLAIALPLTVIVADAASSSGSGVGQVRLRATASRRASRPLAWPGCPQSSPAEQRPTILGGLASLLSSSALDVRQERRQQAEQRQERHSGRRWRCWSGRRAGPAPRRPGRPCRTRSRRTCRRPCRPCPAPAPAHRPGWPRRPRTGSGRSTTVSMPVQNRLACGSISANGSAPRIENQITGLRPMRSPIGPPSRCRPPTRPGTANRWICALCTDSAELVDQVEGVVSC